jgi:benzylsuccinate CoA-transferase BbsF subunit/naphthyl-2-methylsuccinate CoA transferase subunit
MGQPGLATDARFTTLAARKQNEDELEALIQKWTSAHTVEEVVATLQKANVAVGAVADSRCLSTDANLTARDFWVYKEHPEVGTMQHAGIPWKMSGTPTEVKSAAPTLGQHTDEVLTELGYRASDIDQLRKLGALD